MQHGMKMFAAYVLPALMMTGVLVADPAAGQRRGDQTGVLNALREGRVMPLREIERRVVPRMQGSQYIGVEFDSFSGIYTLKFLRDGNVIWVEVDGRSGQIIGRTGN